MAIFLFQRPFFGHFRRGGISHFLSDAAFLLTVASFLLTVELFYSQLTILALLLTVSASLLAVLAFLLTVGAFFAYSGKVHLIRALRDCKQRSLTVSKKAPTVSKKLPPFLFPFSTDFCAGPVSHSVDGHGRRKFKLQ